MFHTFWKQKVEKKQFESKNQNGVKAGLNFEAIRSLKILVPPMELQEKYLTFVNQVNKSKLVIKNLLQIYKHQIQM